MTTATEHPELEDLAAFAEASLESDARAAIEAHLADCDRCLEVVCDTLRCLEETDGAAAPREATLPIASARRLRRVAWAGGLAAAAALVSILAALWVSSRSTSSIAAVATLLEPGSTFDSAFGESWSSPGWTTTRGRDLPALDPSPAAFRLGAHAVDLALAVEQRDAAAARISASGIVDLELESQPSLFRLQDRAVQTLTALSSKPPNWNEARGRSRDLAASAPSARLERSWRLGQWAESARLASLLQSRSSFESRWWRSGLRSLRRIDLSPQADASREALERLPPDQHAQRLELLDALFHELAG